MKFSSHIICFLFLAWSSSYAQIPIPNELPGTGYKEIGHGLFFEIGNNYYFPNIHFRSKNSSNFTSNPIQVLFNKYDFKSNTLLKTIKLGGDTITTDSVLTGNFIGSYDNGKIYIVQNRFYKDSLIPRTSIRQGIVFYMLDTNLNILTPEKLVKFTPKQNNIFSTCGIRSVYANDQKIYITYTQQDTISNIYSRCLIINESGDILFDKFVGIVPDTTKKNLHHEAVEILPYPNSRILITGRGICDSANSDGLLICDSALNIIQNVRFPNWNRYGITGISGYDSRFPNMVALPSGSIISGTGDFFIYEPESLYGRMTCAISKHTQKNSYNFDTTVLFIDPIADLDQTGFPSIHNLVYQTHDNQIYYVSTINSVPFFGCQGPSGLQVVSLDTNLHSKWQKIVSPNGSSCPTVFYVASSDQRSGIDIIGRYRDYYAPNDTSLSGDFIIHIDSLGYLDVKSQGSFNIRDRVMIYPNPAKDFVTVDDYQNQLDRLELMDMLGRRVISKKASSKTETMDISPLAPGNYLLRICLKDGQYLTKKVVRE